MAPNTNQPEARAQVRHAVDCPGGPLCYCGVTGPAASTIRVHLPRPLPTTMKVAPRNALVKLPRPLAKA